MKRVRIFLTALIVGAFMFATPVQADVVCNTYTYTGDDDSAFAANLPFTLSLGSTEYSNVFVSTNGTLTFGNPDGTYWDYPQTPSVSVAGYDWVTFGQGAYLSFGSTANTFCAEWSVRPYPQSTGELTQIRLVINRSDDGGWHGEVVTFGWTPANLRRGIRFEQGQPVVPIAAAFDVNGGVPIEVPPAPVPTSFIDPPVVPTPTLEPTPTSEPSQTATPEPTLTNTPMPTPEPIIEATQSPEPTPIAVVVPEPSVVVVVPEIAPEPVVEPTLIAPNLVPDSEPTVEELTQAVIDDALADGVLTDNERELVADALIAEFLGEPITFEALQESGLDFEDLPPETPVTLENGVVLSAEVADALEIFDSGAEVLATILENPAKALKALVSIGEDMTPEERETSQNTVVAAVVVTQVAQVRKMK